MHKFVIVNSMSAERTAIREAVIKMGLPIAVYIDAAKYCAQLKASKTHHFSQEVVECASIYLATKVDEQYRRIRGSLLDPVINRYSERRSLRP